MPKYTDPTTGKTISSSEPLQPDELEEAFGAVGEASNPKGASTRPWSSVPGEALSNAPASGMDFLKNIYQAAIHPVNTAGSIFKTAVGANKYQLADFFANRYGGAENLKQTIATDPIGFLTDLSTVFTGGELIGTKIPGMAGAANIAEKGAELTNPISLLSKAKAAAMNRIGRTNLPESLMARTMKIPPGSLSAPEREAVLQTMVRDWGLPLGRNTVDTMNDIIGKLDTDITRTINGASAAGETVDLAKVETALDAMKGKYTNRPNPQAYDAVIDTVKNTILDHAYNQGGSMTLADAHQFKKGIYQEIQDYYAKAQKPETGRLGIKNDAEAGAYAEAARVLREEVLNNPSIPYSVKSSMNSEAGLMNARKWVERATNRGGNVDPISLSGMLFSVMMEGGLPAATAFQIAKSQPAMSRIAIALGKTGRTGMGARGTSATNALYQAGRIGNQYPEGESLFDQAFQLWKAGN